MAQQIKFFKSVESELPGMEADINAWLKQSNAKVVQIFGNIAPQTIAKDSGGFSSGERRYAPSDVMIAVVYTTD